MAGGDGGGRVLSRRQPGGTASAHRRPAAAGGASCPAARGEGRRTMPVRVHRCPGERPAGELEAIDLRAFGGVPGVDQVKCASSAARFFAFSAPTAVAKHDDEDAAGSAAASCRPGGCSTMPLDAGASPPARVGTMCGVSPVRADGAQEPGLQAGLFQVAGAEIAGACCWN